MRIASDIVRFWPGRVLGPIVVFAAVVSAGLAWLANESWRDAPAPLQELVLSATAIPITSPFRIHDGPAITVTKGEIIGPHSMAELIESWVSSVGSHAPIALRSPEIIIGGAVPADAVVEGMPVGKGSTIEILDGTLRWSLAAGGELRLDNVAARLELQPSGAIEISNGTADYAGRSLRFGLDAGPATGAAHEHTLRLTLACKGLSAGIEATLTSDGEALEQGRLEVSLEDARDVAAWLGFSLDGTGPAPVKIQGSLTAEAGLVSLEDATVEVSGNRGEGSLRLQLTPGRPLIDATLAFARLDLGDRDQWLQTGLYEPAEGLARKPVGSAASLFDAIDADVRLSADVIRMGKLTTGHGAISATWRDDVLTVQLAGLDLYGGGASGQLDLKPRIGDSRAELALKLDNVDLRRLLSAMDYEAPLEANSHVALALRAAGRSWREARERFSGQVAVRAPDGALTRGGLERAVLAAMGQDGANRTERQAVDGLDWQIAIENGIMTRQSLAFDVNGVRYGAGVKSLEDESERSVAVDLDSLGSR